jgi:hypothetical protein
MQLGRCVRLEEWLKAKILNRRRRSRHRHREDLTRGTDGSVVNLTTDLSGVEVKVKDSIESQVVTSTDDIAESQVVNLPQAVSQATIYT